MSTIDLSQHFLLAMPTMTDPYFIGALIFVCEHNDSGAMGIIVNRPVELNLGDLLDQIELEPAHPDIKRVPIYFGGPVQMERGFVLHQPLGSWQSSLAISDSLGLTTSKDILEAVAQDDAGSPSQYLITLGYAGWESGQLENELAQNAWLSVQADPAIIFNRPMDERYAAALDLLGINPLMLSDQVGHA
jgi:putative transcriptional regulator